jgi:hypothetical protein
MKKENYLVGGSPQLYTFPYSPSSICSSARLLAARRSFARCSLARLLAGSLLVARR